MQISKRQMTQPFDRLSLSQNPITPEMHKDTIIIPVILDTFDNVTWKIHLYYLL